MRRFSLVVLVATGACFSACSKKESPAPSQSHFEKTKAMALAGNAHAQYDFGIVHLEGQLVPKDDAEAVKWFTKAAEQGLPSAQFNLGLMYEQSRGVTSDPNILHGVMAYKWCLLAAVHEPKAHQALPRIEKRITREQRAEGQKLAREFKAVKESP